MSRIELIAASIVLYALAGLLAFALELRARAKHLRDNPNWRPGDRY